MMNEKYWLSKGWFINGKATKKQLDYINNKKKPEYAKLSWKKYYEEYYKVKNYDVNNIYEIY